MPPHAKLATAAVIRRLQEHIVESRMAISARLPSGRELAAVWNIDYWTVHRAIADLVAHGILRRDGYKLFLAKHPDQAPVLPPVSLLCSDDRALAAASEVAALYGSHVTHVACGWQTCRSEIRRLLKAGCEGLLVWPDPWPETLTPVDDLLKPIQSLCVPACVIGTSSTHASSVQMDSRAGAMLAVAHLAALGHKEIACIASPYTDKSLMDGYRAGCLEAGLTPSADRFVLQSGPTACHRLHFPTIRRSYPGLTALFFADARFAKTFVEDPSRGVRIPDDISAIAYGDSHLVSGAQVPITIVAEDHSSLARHAAMLVFGHKREYLRTGRLPPPEQILIKPRLIAHASTMPCHRVTIPASRLRRRGSLGKNNHWPDSLQERQAHVRQARHAAYPATLLAKPCDFAPLDLRPYVNRAFHLHRSWLGTVPLMHLPPGLHDVHGVPFTIIDATTNGKRAAVMMRSSHVHKQLASAVEIKIDSQTLAVYFLHGCGWAADHGKFAEYEVLYEDGATVVIPLVSYGNGPSNQALLDQWKNESNIQDWWPSFKQFENEHARRFIVTQDEDPERYERYLYTLEWINPHPKRRINAITVRSNPDTSHTLGILAITLLLSPRL